MAVKEHKGMGFASAQKNIMKREGLSKNAGGAILANGARNASKSAKKANPNLKNVKAKRK